MVGLRPRLERIFYTTGRPFLIPALLFSVFSSFFAGGYKITDYTEIAGSIADTDQWKQAQRRYKHLCSKFVEHDGDLPYKQAAELRKLERYLNDPHHNQP